MAASSQRWLQPHSRLSVGGRAPSARRGLKGNLAGREDRGPKLGQPLLLSVSCCPRQSDRSPRWGVPEALAAHSWLCHVFFKVNSVLVEGTRSGFDGVAGACGICWVVGWSQAAAPTSGSPPRPGEMNGNFQAAPCSQPNPRGDLSLAAVGQERVGWAASDSSFPCQKVSKASHTFSSSLRQKNTVPPHFGARSLLPAASKPGGKPLPPVRLPGTPAPWGKGPVAT